MVAAGGLTPAAAAAAVRAAAAAADVGSKGAMKGNWPALAAVGHSPAAAAAAAAAAAGGAQAAKAAQGWGRQGIAEGTEEEEEVARAFASSAALAFADWEAADCCN